VVQATLVVSATLMPVVVVLVVAAETVEMEVEMELDPKRPVATTLQ
jgi:hypothetical protein